MPMPHRTFAQVAGRRLVGKEGRERIREVRRAPGGAAGLHATGRTRTCARRCSPRSTRRRSARERRAPRLDRRAPGGRGPGRARRRAQRRQVVDPPGALGDRDPDRRLCVHDPAADPGADPDRGRASSSWSRSRGCIEGATDDRGGGRALLGVLRAADAIVYCARAGADPTSSPGAARGRGGRHRAGPSIVAATRADEAPAGAIDALQAALPSIRVVPVSVLDERILDALRGGDLAADRAHPRVAADATAPPTTSRSRCDPAGHRRGRRRQDPPRARGDDHRGAHLGPLGAVRRPARRTRSRASPTAMSVEIIA